MFRFSTAVFLVLFLLFSSFSTLALALSLSLSFTLSLACATKINCKREKMAHISINEETRSHTLHLNVWNKHDFLDDLGCYWYRRAFFPLFIHPFIPQIDFGFALHFQPVGSHQSETHLWKWWKTACFQWSVKYKPYWHKYSINVDLICVDSMQNAFALNKWNTRPPYGCSKPFIYSLPWIPSNEHFRLHCFGYCCSLTEHIYACQCFVRKMRRMAATPDTNTEWANKKWKMVDGKRRTDVERTYSIKTHVCDTHTHTQSLALFGARSYKVSARARRIALERLIDISCHYLIDLNCSLVNVVCATNAIVVCCLVSVRMCIVKYVYPSAMKSDEKCVWWAFLKADFRIQFRHRSQSKLIITKKKLILNSYTLPLVSPFFPFIPTMINDGYNEFIRLNACVSRYFFGRKKLTWWLESRQRIWCALQLPFDRQSIQLCNIHIRLYLQKQKVREEKKE